MKSFSSKFFAISFAIVFATGCASVTDANLDAPETSETTIETTTTDGSFWDSRAGDDMEPIIDRPRSGGTID